MIITEKTRAMGNVCEYVREKEREGKCTDEGKRKRGSSHTFSSKASTFKFVSPAQVGRRRRRKWLNDPRAVVRSAGCWQSCQESLRVERPRSSDRTMAAPASAREDEESCLGRSFGSQHF